MSRREDQVERGGASLALSGAFVGMGLSGALPPAILPVLARQTGLTPGAASLVVSGVFAGLFLGVGAAALAWAAIPPARLLKAGAWLQAGGLLLMAHDAAPQEVVGGAWLLGVGFGITELSATALVRGLEAVTGLDLTRRTSLTALTAAVTPVLLGLLVAVGYWRPLFVAAAALHLLIAMALDDGEPVPIGPATSWRRAASSRRHLVIVAAYVGGEALLVAWFARIAGTSLRLGIGPTVAASAAFWVAIAAGRRVGSRLLAAGMPARRLLGTTLMLAIAALGVAAATGGVPRAVALTVALVAAGPVYPLVLATAPGATDARVLAPLIAAGSLGGALVTGIGPMAYRSAGQPGVLLLAAGVLTVCLLAGGSWRPEGRRRAGERSSP